MTKARPAADNAALVNGLLVLLLPLAFFLIGGLLSPMSSDSSTTVRASDPRGMSLVLFFGLMALSLMPLAILAWWRTRVHAREWIADRGRWRGVLESGMCAVALALLYLAPGVLTRPAEAPPYVIFYGGVALVLGLIVGLFLHAAAVFTLNMHRPPLD